MGLLRREFLERLGRVVFFAIAPLFLLAPGTASAGCNNRAHSPASPLWRTAPLAALLQGDPATVPATTDAPASPPPRCSGPSCSNNAPASLPTVVSPDLGRYHGDSLLAIAPRLSVSASRVFHPADEPLAPAFRTSRIFHPPRPLV
jgi:hypothetical protein